jgi:murein DD-endopeptidase / murein LD-carboxypeptidase
VQKQAVCCNFATMKWKILGILFIISSLQVSAQQIANTETSAPVANTHSSDAGFFEDYFKGYYSQVFGIAVTDIINLSLYSTIEKWIGTPYRYAGKTFSGIDCSSFVNKIYENAYCLFLPNSSAEMYKQVKHIQKDQLTEGDLVFFKINRNKSISHVGVYLGNNKFAHASRSNGVIISDLTQPYYQKHFVKGGRVEFPAN